MRRCLDRTMSVAGLRGGYVRGGAGRLSRESRGRL